MRTHANASLFITCLAAIVLTATPLAAQNAPSFPDVLPNTKPLKLEGDIASHMIDGIDRFLLKELEASVEQRAEHWKRDFSSPEAYNKSIEPNRQRLAHILGVRDPRVKFDAPQLIATVGQEKPGLVGKGDGYDIFAVRWPVLADPDPGRDSVTIHGEGLLLVPTNPPGGKPVADVIAIPHCDHTPEQIVGLAKGVPAESQFARRLAESGCRVIVPMLINRSEKFPKLTHREWLYRSAFELGRHLIGYEVQKVLACVDWFEKDRQSDEATERQRDRQIVVVGYGEGGMLALYAGALDTRINATCVSGHFGTMEDVWRQPIDRNVFGLLREFGDGELASMFPPRKLVVEAVDHPTAEWPGGIGGVGAPARIETPDFRDIRRQTARASNLLGDLREYSPIVVSDIGDEALKASGPPLTNPTLILRLLTGIQVKKKPGAAPRSLVKTDPISRHKRQVEEIDRHNQLLLRESEYVRQKAFWSKLDLSSVDDFQRSARLFRRQFRDDVIGTFDRLLQLRNARSRKMGEEEEVVRYHVVLDVYPDVIAYGILTLPKDMKRDGSEKRPVVVCQHGLEGRPQDVIGKKGHQYYKAFATTLARRGFVTFAPQNIYIFGDRFRTLQRKANPLGKTLFSIMVPQHQQITDFLKTQPFVDGQRIAFYGLSYGGKSAMRIPPLVSNYCLSICSADFNEWVDKNASTRTKYSYADKGEYEIFEWDLGSTFNYAEMAALIAPRPFMVERGHDDGVAADETVAYEYAKVRRLYNKLGIGERTEIEFFNGPHAINGVGTFEFLHEHLRWPKREE